MSLQSLVNAFEYHIQIESMQNLRSITSNDATKKNINLKRAIRFKKINARTVQGHFHPLKFCWEHAMLSVSNCFKFSDTNTQSKK